MSSALPVVSSPSSPVPEAPSGATGVGSYFVSNYPPFAAWSEAALADVRAVVERAPVRDVPMGLYVHVPFCRKRCRFCYFKVTIGADADEVRAYVEAVVAEARSWSRKPAWQGRAPRFVYIGGGTPSFLSVSQLERLLTGLREAFDWSQVEEFAFEAEPGTVSEEKLRTLKSFGVTRLSLGVESWDPEVLATNGRAHDVRQAVRAFEAARAAGLPQVNLDLIAGMVGETEATWFAGVRKTLELRPDSVTLYQVELPFNTVYSREARGSSEPVPVADWETKRRWVGQAFAMFEAAGYRAGSGYTLTRDDSVHFRYRDELWHGADMLGLGVSAFSHLQGAHFQAEKEQPTYVEQATAGALPLSRGYVMTPDERLIREAILRLKLGALDVARLGRDFGVDARDRFGTALGALVSSGLAAWEGDVLRLSRPGLLRVDSLLPAFYGPAFRVERA